MSLFAAAENASKRQFQQFGSGIGGFKEFLNFFGGGESASGVNVDEDNMISLSGIFNAITLLSETVAQQPLSPFLEYEENDLTKLRKYKEHPTYSLVSYEALPGFMTAYTWRKLMVNYVARWQNGYSVIERNGNYRPKGLIPIHPTRVIPKVTSDSRLVYQIDGGEMEISAINMIHIIGFTDDGLSGKSLASIGKDSIGHALATERFGGMYFGKGINQSGFIQHPGRLKDEDAVERLKSSFVKKYGGLNNSFGVGILEDGAEYKPTDVEPEKAQLHETRKLNIEEVARWLNVPVPLLKQIDQMTYNNAEQIDIQFTKYTITPWNVNIEQELRRKLLTEREKRAGNIYFKHNMNGLLRGDTKSRASLYDTMQRTGAFSPNDIRELEDKNPYEGGDIHVINPGAQSVENLNNQDNGNNVPNG